MFNYDSFENYGLELPFGAEVLETAGQAVEGATLTDIRAQALRLSPEQRIDSLRKSWKARY